MSHSLRNLVFVIFTAVVLSACQSGNSNSNNSVSKSQSTQNQTLSANDTHSGTSSSATHHETMDDSDHESSDHMAVSEVEDGLSVMVLGSGGPMALPNGRASAGYLIFINKKPLILMDAGGGTFERLAKSGTNVKDLKIALLSHLHIDHTEDLSAIVKTMYFHNRNAGTYRTDPISIYGPSANGITFTDSTVTQYPASSDYVNGLYNKNTGLFRYLNVFATAINGGDFAYSIKDLPCDFTSPDSLTTILDEDGLVIKSIGVNHGPVPAVGYRIEYGGKSIVYSGDTSSLMDNMITLGMDADLLIYDTSITDDEPSGPTGKIFFKLHTTPTRMGQVATAANAKKLVLSHLTTISEPRVDEIEKLIRDQGYQGEISVAKDLKVYNLH